MLDDPEAPFVTEYQPAAMPSSDVLQQHLSLSCRIRFRRSFFPQTSVEWFTPRIREMSYEGTNRDGKYWRGYSIHKARRAWEICRSVNATSKHD